MPDDKKFELKTMNVLEPDTCVTNFNKLALIFHEDKNRGKPKHTRKLYEAIMQYLNWFSDEINEHKNRSDSKSSSSSSSSSSNEHENN